MITTRHPSLRSCRISRKSIITFHRRYSLTSQVNWDCEAKVYGVATFYENFSLEPKGKYVIKICDGTACHVRNSTAILNEIRSVLGVSQEHPTTEDMMFTVETVSCLGACGLAPVCTVNDKVHPAMTPEKARALIEELKEEAANEN